MSTTLTSSRGAFGPPSRGARAGVALLAGVLAFGAAAIVSSQWPSSDGPASTAASAARRLDPAAELAQLEARVAADPSDGPAWQRLAAFAIDRAAGSGSRELVLAAEHAVEQAELLVPGQAATFHVRAQFDLTLHQFAAAHEVGLAAHAAHPDSADPLAVLFDSSIELGRYSEAEGHLQLLLSLRPDAAALARVSYLREIRGDLAGARAAMAQAETAAAGSPAETGTVATLVGDLALAAGEPSTALQAYERAEAAEPGNATTAVGRGRALHALGRTDEAVTVLEASYAAFAEPAVMTILAELYEATGRTDDAAALYAETAALIDRHGASGEDNSLEAARFHADHADPADAVRFARIAYRNRPTVFAADALMWALTRDGAAEEAVGYLDASRREGTDQVDMHVHAAVTLAAVGRADEATAELARAFEQFPYAYPELRPIALELAAELGVTVPAAWAGA